MTNKLLLKFDLKWAKKYKTELQAINKDKNATKEAKITAKINYDVAIRMYREKIKENLKKMQVGYYCKPLTIERVFGDDSDGFNAYIILPPGVKSKQDAIEFYEDCLNEDCVPSQYDCTGQRFTMLAGVQKRSDGRFGVYIFYRYDV